MKFKLLSVFALVAVLWACDPATTKSITDTANGILGGSGTAADLTPSNDEIISGLKEALSTGAVNSSSFASKLDGFNKNPRLFIPFPPEAQKMKQKLIDLGMQNKVTEFETSLNRAAEEAAKDAAPIFVNAIKGMTVTDAMGILKGGDTAATHYLREKTYASLVETFKPTVKNAIAKVEVTKYWNPLVTTYNKIPFVEKQNPDLDSYVTQLAARGLFTLVKDEEAKIRKDPMARATDILKKVFGYADKNK
ncbi:MAG: hypothetical protein K0S33_2487 [Bacteroidetes bacterium]|jgi:hypothetical protein|nr:hypothetical protein [Bacteroidota bacterium]